MSQDQPAPAYGTLSTSIRLLTFRATAAELARLDRRHFLLGLICTWLVGMGRYWDNPRVSLAQHLGVGSVVYIFALALLLWLVLLPLRPKHWSYFRVVTFVSLVSPPAVLYAIPVEKFFSLETANSVNIWFLAIVATWRVALLFFFLRRLGGLHWFSILVAGLLPLTLVVVVLTALNLEKVVLDLMGGGHHRSANDGAYVVLYLLSVLSALLFVPLLVCYFVLAVRTELAARRKKLLTADTHD